MKRADEREAAPEACGVDPELDERRQEQRIPADAAETEEETVQLYNVSPAVMPPSPAGANAEVGGEAAASRRVAGLPEDIEREPRHTPGVATPGKEPFLGYDGLATDDIVEWIDLEDPDPEDLRRIFDYERAGRHREAVLHECKERLRRFGQRPGPHEV